jgi:hypothetical protein
MMSFLRGVVIGFVNGLWDNWPGTLILLLLWGWVAWHDFLSPALQVPEPDDRPTIRNVP